MLKKLNAVYIFSDHPFLNVKSTSIFEKFNLNDSVYLYSLLLINNLNNIVRLKNNTNIVCLIDNVDKDFIPKNLIPDEANLYFVNTKNNSKKYTELKEDYFQHHQNNLLIHLNAFGISTNRFVKTLDLLSVEDESIVIGKTNKDEISFIGTNNINEDIYQEFFHSKLNYDKYLADISMKDNFLHVLSEFFVINNFEDFKELYDILSKKESLEFCSQEMHEKFTHLFIEYKELLK